MADRVQTYRLGRKEGLKEMADIRELREINLQKVMEALGHEPEEHFAQTFVYRLEDNRKLAVTPEPLNARTGRLGMFNVFNGDAYEGKSGGAGAVNLVIAVTGKSLKEAAAWLANTFFAGEQTLAPTPRPKSRTPEPLPLLERRFALPEKHLEGKEALKKYLCATRGLSPGLVEQLQAEGTIYPHIHRYVVNGQRRSFTNAVFVMRDDQTREPTGSMIRGCYDGLKPRKSTLPFENGNAAAFWWGEPLASARRIVLTESPLECLSYLELHQAPGIHSRTYGGNRWREVKHIFDRVKERGGELICAFNNDEAGHHAAKALAQMCYSAKIRFQREVPIAKDWNDDLRQKPRTPTLL